MPSPSPEAFLAAQAYVLCVAREAARGPAGERLGKAAGASLEFQDRRAYVPGDDVRHLDWGAYARSDQLMVRLYREEVSPRVDLIVDGSRSMQAYPGKAQGAVDLALVLALAARRAGLALRIVRVADRCEVLPSAEFEARGLEFDGRRVLPETLGAGRELLRPGSLRIVLSDFLFPGEPAHLVRPLVARAGGLVLLQVLGAEDAQPPRSGALRLTDSESGANLDLVVDEGRAKDYAKRLDRHVRVWSEECRRVAGRWLSIVADADVDTLCRRDLVPHGLITVE